MGETPKTGRAAQAAEFSDRGRFTLNVPRDPAVAGTVGKRRAAYQPQADPDGNRAERRAAARRRKRTR